MKGAASVWGHLYSHDPPCTSDPESGGRVLQVILPPATTHVALQVSGLSVVTLGQLRLFRLLSSVPGLCPPCSDHPRYPDALAEQSSG